MTRNRRLTVNDPTPSLSTFLPLAVRGRRLVGRVRDEELTGWFTETAERVHVDDVSNILKRTGRRLVFRDGNVVVKVVFLGSLHRKRKWRRYGYMEAKSLHHAASLGLAVPRVLAQGRLRRWCDPLVASLLAIEFLADRSTVSSQLAAAVDSGARRRVLDQAAGILVDLTRTGCFHVDVGPDNLFLPSPGCVGTGPAVIDLEYAEFVAPGQVAQLVRQASRLVCYCRKDWPELDYVGWFDGVLSMAREVCQIDVSGRDLARREFARGLEMDSFQCELPQLVRAA